MEDLVSGAAKAFWDFYFYNLFKREGGSITETSALKKISHQPVQFQKQSGELRKEKRAKGSKRKQLYNGGAQHFRLAGGHTWWCSGSPAGCRGSNPAWLRARLRLPAVLSLRPQHFLFPQK